MESWIGGARYPGHPHCGLDRQRSFFKRSNDLRCLTCKQQKDITHTIHGTGIIYLHEWLIVVVFMYGKYTRQPWMEKGSFKHDFVFQKSTIPITRNCQERVVTHPAEAYDFCPQLLILWTHTVFGKQTPSRSWLVVSTHLKNMIVKLDHFPR